jgi:protein-disulfide isomerase
MPEINPSARWYQKGWMLALVGFGTLVLALGVIFLVLTVQYWWQIKHGAGAALQQKFYGEFSVSDINKEGKAVKVDRSELESADSPFLGNPKAPVVIVEFVDFKCPNCQTAAPVMRKLLDKYAYKVKWITRHFPAESLHPGTSKLSELAQCAFEQEKYWQMHDVLFGEQDNIGEEVGPDQMRELAEKAGVDFSKMDACLSDPKTKIKINMDYSAGYRYEVGGTPTFFVNGDKVEGVVPFDVWENFVKNF